MNEKLTGFQAELLILNKSLKFQVSYLYMDGIQVDVQLSQPSLSVPGGGGGAFPTPLSFPSFLVLQSVFNILNLRGILSFEK